MPRDLRDPQKLGEALLHAGRNRDQGNLVPLSSHYDENKAFYEKLVSDYDHGETLVTETVRAYRLDLKRRAEAGDRHAADTLRGIPNDDPSG